MWGGGGEPPFVCRRMSWGGGGEKTTQVHMGQKKKEGRSIGGGGKHTIGSTTYSYEMAGLNTFPSGSQST